MLQSNLNAEDEETLKILSPQRQFTPQEMLK
jgi:hypothetical protein